MRAGCCDARLRRWLRGAAACSASAKANMIESAIDAAHVLDATLYTAMLVATSHDADRSIYRSSATRASASCDSSTAASSNHATSGSGFNGGS
mmetsp:Transcript_36433/g.67309  ORF Transcript_36433/g.67309 Transcript_36433/m.67309 type:complete len:93 (-) Transcript_36433:773-1051(-)